MASRLDDLERYCEIAFTAASRATEESQRLRREIDLATKRIEALERSPVDSEPPESTQTEIKSPNGWRVRAPAWTAILLSLLMTGAVLSYTLRELWKH